MAPPAEHTNRALFAASTARTGLHFHYFLLAIIRRVIVVDGERPALEDPYPRERIFQQQQQLCPAAAAANVHERSAGVRSAVAAIIIISSISSSRSSSICIVIVVFGHGHRRCRWGGGGGSVGIGGGSEGGSDERRADGHEPVERPRALLCHRHGRRSGEFFFSLSGCSFFLLCIVQLSLINPTLFPDPFISTIDQPITGAATARARDSSSLAPFLVAEEQQPVRSRQQPRRRRWRRRWRFVRRFRHRRSGSARGRRSR